MAGTVRPGGALGVSVNVYVRSRMRPVTERTDRPSGPLRLAREFGPPRPADRYRGLRRLGLLPAVLQAARAGLGGRDPGAPDRLVGRVHGLVARGPAPVPVPARTGP